MTIVNFLPGIFFYEIYQIIIWKQLETLIFEGLKLQYSILVAVNFLCYVLNYL
jgi:hypothetical protein